MIKFYTYAIQETTLIARNQINCQGDNKLEGRLQDIKNQQNTIKCLIYVVLSTPTIIEEPYQGI